MKTPAILNRFRAPYINGKIPTLSVAQVHRKPDLDELRVEKILALNGLVTKFKLAA